ncbi:MAG TPA: hypothetical protein VF541_22625 [Longimicrobium sp.]
MPGPLVHVGATIMCPHGGTAQVVPGNPRVAVSAPVATMADAYPIVGCPFQIPVGAGTKPQPCIRVQWLAPATRVAVNGAPAILQASAGMCFSAEGIPQGPPTIAATQPRVTGI